MRRCLCANVNVMVDDVDVTIDDDDVTIDDVDVTVDDDDVTFTHNGLKLIYILNYAHVPATPVRLVGRLLEFCFQLLPTVFSILPVLEFFFLPVFISRCHVQLSPSPPQHIIVDNTGNTPD